MRVNRLLLPVFTLLLAVPAAGENPWGPLLPRERQALIDLYKATDGEDWINNEGWLGPPGTECDWHGIECACLSGTEGPCPFVFGLVLEGNNLNGYLPRSVRILRHLRTLSLARNRLRGELPDELGQLRRLRWLSLDSNRFSGEIPSALGALTRIQWLTISDNRLVGSLPGELVGLQNLWVLSFDQNRLTGDLPRWLGSLPELEALGLSQNHFSGPIPEEIFNLKDLHELSLAFNHLTGRIPSNIGNPELHIVHLEGNRLSGPVPETVLDLDFLSYINVNWNAVYPTSPEVEQFFIDRGGFLGWVYTQTLAPENLAAVATGPSSIRLTWTPAFHAPREPHEMGGYLVYAKEAVGSRLRRIKTVPGKDAGSVDVTGLAPGTTYIFRARTFSRPHLENQNVVWSELSQAVAVTTPPSQPVERRLP